MKQEQARIEQNRIRVFSVLAVGGSREEVYMSDMGRKGRVTHPLEQR